MIGCGWPTSTRSVTWISSQPLWLSSRDGSSQRRHVPDFLLEHVDGAHTVVDVTPEAMLTSPAVVEVFVWTRRLCSAKGRHYAVWHESDPVVLRNVRFIAAGHRVRFIDRDTLVKVAETGAAGMTSPKSRLARA